jgi:hypothetical protein
VETDERQLAAVQDEMEALAGAADQEVEELEAAERDGENDGESRAGSPNQEPTKKPGEGSGKKPPGISLVPASPSAMDVESSSSVGRLAAPGASASPTPSPGPGTEATTPGNDMDVGMG